MNLSARLLPGIPLVESPLFESSLESAGLSPAQEAIARSLNERGYAVIDFPDADIEQRIERVKNVLGAHFGIDPDRPESLLQLPYHRIQDAWALDSDVKAIATNPEVLELLAALYGRRPLPFQTLNFPVGTQQHLHSDSVHFSSIPERFMCGVWLAMEDIHADAGPLEYLPGSHKWPILTNSMIGRRGWRNTEPSAQRPFEDAWRTMIESSGSAKDTFFARKGQALIWAANLLHGGAPQVDPLRTRWSQVTHYYFENCIYYTPAFSDEALGLLDLRQITNILTGTIEENLYLGREIANHQAQKRNFWRDCWHRLRSRLNTFPPRRLPDDFNSTAYMQLNPDVAVAGVDPAQHYLLHGQQENRQYHLPI